MRKSDRGLLYQDLDRLFRRGTVSSGDGALLNSFLTEGNEAAFEALVNRHGPMVRGVCRRLLTSPHDADDAFQATFLVLVRKGGRLRDPDRLGPWLHGVATRVARKARARASRRKDEALIDVPAREDGSAEWSDVMPIIDAELARLPLKHRDVLVACLLDGATADEASRRLACPVGTVKSRLARARESLRARLTSRGVAPAVALAALETTDAFAFASPVSSTLIRATLRTATTKAVAPGVAALTEGVASAMISKSTFTIAAAVGFGLAGLGAAAWLKPSLAQEQPQRQTQPRPEPPALPSDRRRSQAEVTNRHLREILLAAHNYHSVNGCFPAPFSIRDGKPLLSWRVALLPYLGHNELYQQFQLDEPWDSPHNKVLIDRMPAVFETADAPTIPGKTRINVFIGPNAVFEPFRIKADGQENKGSGVVLNFGVPRKRQGVGIEEITDGTSNTVFVAIAKRSTPWTAPGGLGYIPGRDDTRADLDDSDPRGIVLGMCDGSVRVLPKAHQNRQTLAALITRNGGEVVDQSIFADMPSQLPEATAAETREHSTPPIPGGRPDVPTAAPASSIEQRLERLEAKFDRLLEKLDAK